MRHYQAWLIENKVVYVKFVGEISVEEIGEAFAKSNALVLESEKPPVHFLHNWSEVTNFPKKLSEMRRLTKAVKGDLRRIGWVVAFGTENRLIRFLGDVFFQLFRIRFRMFRTEKEAISFLRRMDITLEEFPSLPIVNTKPI